MPVPLFRAVGVYFHANGNFYTVGGRTADIAGSDFPHVLQYSPSSNTWTQMGVALPDNQVNNMACGVLAVAGTPFIYCVGGSAAGQPTAAARVFVYNPATDTVTTLAGADDWPGDASGTILPGGFVKCNNKLYILGGFNINVASTNQIWQFDPTAPVGSKWTQMVNTPEGIMFAPACCIGGIIYVGGASAFQGGTVVDTTNSFSFNPATNTIGSIEPIPRATGETRALNFNDVMLVMGGGRVAPNPSSEVDIYDPGTDTWTTGVPVPDLGTPRTNFPTDTDETTTIWLAGGYVPPPVSPNSMEIFCRATPLPTSTPTLTPTATVPPTPTPSPAGCSVVSRSPPCGGIVVGTPPTDFTVDLSAPEGGVQGSVFMVNGTPANSVTVLSGGTQLVFHFDTSPVVEGQNTMHIPACAFPCGEPGGCVYEFTCTFTYQASTPTPRPTPTPRLAPSPRPRPTPMPRP